MKYRLLEKAELENLEKEFTEYLAVNGIDADEWQRLKKEELDKAESVIDLFSDVVMESVLRNIQFLDHISPYSIKSFQCLKDKIVLIGLDIPKDAGIDFTKVEDLDALDFNSIKGIQVYTQEKEYNKERETELFDMTEKGAVANKGEYFKALALML